MKFFGAFIIFVVLFFVVIVLCLLLFLRKLIIRFKKHLTGDYDDETYRRMADKYYSGADNAPNFDKDYFKGSGTSRRGAYRGDTSGRQYQKKESTTTTTSEGTTIIDERSQGERKQKIFAKDEGEYVEFTEE